MKVEKWKPVHGYQGIYEVSNFGRVRSLDRFDSRGWARKGRIIRPSKRPSGHLMVGLHDGGRSQSFLVHRLVALTFIGPQPLGMECCHNDGEPSNNSVENLRWGTRSENQMDRVRHGRHPMKLRTHCPRGHALVEPNLVPFTQRLGHRGCRACHRASSYANKRRIPKSTELADEFYERLMSCV